MKKSFKRITAALVAMTAAASFATAPLSNAEITFKLPNFNTYAAEEILTYQDYSYKVTDDGIIITAYSGTEKNLVIPSAIDETAVIAIGNSAFAKNTSIVSVTIPESVTTIEGAAFKNCTSLEKVTLNEGLTTLKAECFENTKISSITIPSTL
ncbi:MAG: leucine-rich repeat domain-containing protein, partial [Ruminococcus sp.]|nr:leucine-rich repeat domain-containing protein [Ruminococcus sp.]